MPRWFRQLHVFRLSYQIHVRGMGKGAPRMPPPPPPSSPGRVPPRPFDRPRQKPWIAVNAENCIKTRGERRIRLAGISGIWTWDSGNWTGEEKIPFSTTGLPSAGGPRALRNALSSLLFLWFNRFFRSENLRNSVSKWNLTTGTNEDGFYTLA